MRVLFRARDHVFELGIASYPLDADNLPLKNDQGVLNREKQEGATLRGCEITILHWTFLLQISVVTGDKD